MKKLILNIIVISTIIHSKTFAMYSATSDWNKFLTHPNKFVATVEQFGFVLGNGSVRGTFGFKGNNVIFNSVDSVKNIQINPTISAGLGYTSDIFSIGLGYSYQYNHKYLSTHTPVLMFNFLNKQFRLVIPVSIATTDKYYSDSSLENKNDYKYLGLSTDTHIRYYTGLDIMPQLRFYVKYGINQKDYKTVGSVDTIKESASSLGLDFRAYFYTVYEGIEVEPFIKITYNTALDAEGKVGNTSTRVSAGKEYGLRAPKTDEEKSSAYIKNPFALTILPALGLTAKTDIIELYVEPSLGYKLSEDGFNKLLHSLAWAAYGEIYITPIENLEWYFEADVGSTDDPTKSQVLEFATSTGITWYLPKFD